MRIYLWRINGHSKHLPLNKPTNMDENRPKGKKPISFFAHVRFAISSSVCGTADPNINVSFQNKKSPIWYIKKIPVGNASHLVFWNNGNQYATFIRD